MIYFRMKPKGFGFFTPSTKRPGIWAVQANGKNLHLITTSSVDALAVSPDGQSLYCVCFANGSRELAVMDPDGSHRRTVVGTETFDPLAVHAISGVGTTVVTPTRDSIGLLSEDGTVHGLYTVPASSGITIFGNIVISADGRTIAFEERIPAGYCPTASSCQTLETIQEMGSGGGQPRILASEPNDPNDCGHLQLTGISADGSRALDIGGLEQCAEGSGSPGVRTLGSGEQTFPPFPSNYRYAQPVLSPDGTQVAYPGGDPSRWSLYVSGLFTVGLDGSGLRRVVPRTPVHGMKVDEVLAWGNVAYRPQRSTAYRRCVRRANRAYRRARRRASRLGGQVARRGALKRAAKSRQSALRKCRAARA